MGIAAEGEAGTGHKEAAALGEWTDLEQALQSWGWPRPEGV